MRKRVLSLGAVAFVLTGAATGCTVSHGVHQASSPGRPNATPTPTAAADDGHDAAAALARLATDPASLVAAGAQPQVQTGAREGVPAGSVVAAAEDTWSPDGIGGGTMTVTVTPPGGPAVSYAAVMVHEPTGWKVLATVPLADK